MSKSKYKRIIDNRYFYKKVIEDFYNINKLKLSNSNIFYKV